MLLTRKVFFLTYNMGNLILNVLYFIKKSSLFCVDSYFASIYDVKTRKKNYKSRQEELKFELCFVKIIEFSGNYKQ